MEGINGKKRLVRFYKIQNLTSQLVAYMEQMSLLEGKIMPTLR